MSENKNGKMIAHFGVYVIYPKRKEQLKVEYQSFCMKPDMTAVAHFRLGQNLI